MEIEILKIMNDGLYLSLLLVIKAIALITIFFAIGGFAIYLTGIAWFYFEETRRPARRQMRQAPKQPELDKAQLLTLLAALDGDIDGSLIGSVSRRSSPTVKTIVWEKKQ